MPEVDVGHGTTVTLSTNTAWDTVTGTAEITNISWTGIERTVVETSHMGTAAATAGNFGNRTYIPGDLTDPGTLDMEYHFNPARNPVIDLAAETITITFPDSSTWSASGFFSSMEVQDVLDDKMTMTASFKLSGLVTTA